MRITCGTLSRVSNSPNKFEFMGEVTLIQRLNGKLALVKAARSGKSKDAPDYDVLYCPNGERTMYPLGAAWLKNSDKVSGKDFLSLTVFMPDWSEPANLTAFPPEGDGKDWTVVYSRPRGARVQEQVAA